MACWRRRPSTGTAPDRALTAEDRLERGVGNGPLHVDQTTFRSFQNRSNNYGLDRQVQKTASYSGIDGINQQDGPADKAIIQARKFLPEAVKDVEAGRPPAGTGTSYYTVKAGEDVFARDADWHRALAPDITKDRILQTV